MARGLMTPSPDAPLPLRPSCRGFLVDPDDRVLLVQHRTRTGDVWVAPGGRVEPGESHQQTLVDLPAARDAWARFSPRDLPALLPAALGAVDAGQAWEPLDLAR